MKIHGSNLGNWLVLEKWMEPELFAGTGAEDEVWMSRKLAPEDFAAKLKAHRDSYVTEADFAFLAEQGLRTVRLPVTYGVFGDRPPLVGAIEYVDMAMDWAERYGLQILLDLHTVPYSQNGYDNGGLTGVCKWCRHPEEVAFALTVLERLAERYGKRPGLCGIEVLNEPISWLVYVTAPSTGKAVNKEEAKGSGHVPLRFLKGFYTEAYTRLRAILPEDKLIVFHDGFRFTAWNSFFRRSGMKNVALDTHIYIFAMELFVPLHRPWVYAAFINYNRRFIRRVRRDVPVIVGEWCICNRYADHLKNTGMRTDACDAEQLRRYREIAELELTAWQEADGWFYWNYQLLRDRDTPMDESWKESWDLCRCLKRGWLSSKDF